MILIASRMSQPPNPHPLRRAIVSRSCGCCAIACPVRACVGDCQRHRRACRVVQQRVTRADLAADRSRPGRIEEHRGLARHGGPAEFIAAAAARRRRRDLAGGPGGCRGRDQYGPYRALDRHPGADRGRGARPDLRRTAVPLWPVPRGRRAHRRQQRSVRCGFAGARSVLGHPRPRRNHRARQSAWVRRRPNELRCRRTT